MAPEAFLEKLHVPDAAMEELKNIDAYHFDIFKFRKNLTGCQYSEMEIVVPYLLQKMDVFGCEQLKDKLNFNVYMNFLAKIAKGYK